MDCRLKKEKDTKIEGGQFGKRRGQVEGGTREGSGGVNMIQVHYSHV
jgi:hypothetical protein